MSAATKYIKFYNKATAPTVGTDIPIFTFPIAASTINALDFCPSNDMGQYFSVGIAFAVTGALVDTDNTVLAANDVVINAQFI